MPLLRSSRREYTCTHMSNYQTCNQTETKKFRTSSPEFSANNVGRLRLPEKSQLVPVDKACSSLVSLRLTLLPLPVCRACLQFTNSSRALHCCRKWISLWGTSYSHHRPSFAAREQSKSQSQSRKSCRQNKGQSLRRVGLCSQEARDPH